MGRPSGYSPELGDEICAQLAEGKSLRTVCLAEGMPDKSTALRWLRIHPEFRAQYARAKDEAADVFIEDMIDISDDGTNDYMQTVDSEGAVGWKVNGESVQRSKLRVDTRKWIASKLKPKKYGEKVDVTSDGKPMQTPTIQIVGYPDERGDGAEG